MVEWIFNKSIGHASMKLNSSTLVPSGVFLKTAVAPAQLYPAGLRHFKPLTARQRLLR
jgi:hypothetical protein